MTNSYCLNCDTQLIGKYCAGCGQKANTQRISIKNFLFNDILHGTFHIERGMFYTAKQAIIRPGEAAMDYIAGKRKRYYNVFYLILITVGLMLFIRHYYDELITAEGGAVVKKSLKLDENSKAFANILSQKRKIIILLFVPFAAFNSFILFRKQKLNLSEHSIIAGMVLLGVLLFSTLGNILFYFDLLFKFNDAVANTISISIISLIFLYIIYGYFNAFGRSYSKIKYAFKIILFFALICLEIFVIFIILFGIASKWKFGDVTISLFN